MEIKCTTQEFADLQGKDKIQVLEEQNRYLTGELAAARTSCKDAQNQVWDYRDQVSTLLAQISERDKQIGNLLARQETNSPGVSTGVRYLSLPNRTKLDEIFTFVKHGEKINAIKSYRELTGLGLRECKEAIEVLMPPNPHGCQF